MNIKFAFFYELLTRFRNIQGELKKTDTFEMQISRTAFLQFDRQFGTKHIK